MDNNMTDEEEEKLEEEQERLEEERYRLKELQEQQTIFYVYVCRRYVKGRTGNVGNF